MPLLHVNGTDLFYEDTGPGSTGETIVFSHGLLFSTLMWEAQMRHFRDRYRCIAYDHRGQGRSAESTLFSIGMELVYDDALGVLDKLVDGPVHFVGLSMGGFVGMRIAARQPARLRSLALFETSAEPEPAENIPKYTMLAWVARALGIGLVADRVEPIMFGKTFRTDPARASERRFWRERLIENRRTIHRAVRGVTDRLGILEEIASITVPTLVAVGDEDVATVPAKAERIHEAIPRSRFAKIPGAGHSASIEQPARVNALLEEFYESLTPGTSPQTEREG
jgi:pimeloyl-ACP methyl ester carboxylesterase